MGAAVQRFWKLIWKLNVISVATGSTSAAKALEKILMTL